MLLVWIYEIYFFRTANYMSLAPELGRRKTAMLTCLPKKLKILFIFQRKDKKPYESRKFPFFPTNKQNVFFFFLA